MMVLPDRCISTYPAVFINRLSDACMGCTMIKNIENGQMPGFYETMMYAVLLLTEIGIVIVSLLRSAISI